MNIYWAIEYVYPRSTWIDYTSIRSTRRETWRAFDANFEGATPKYLSKLKRERRKGLIRAVKVRVVLA